MSISCPNVNKKDPKYKKLTSLVNEADAYKLIMKNQASADPLAKALEVFDTTKNPVDRKYQVMMDFHNKVHPENTTDPETGHKTHTYTDPDGEEMTSVSRHMDSNPQLKYRGDEAGREYADTGTAAHEVLHMYAMDNTEENIRYYMEQNNLPESIYTQLRVIVDKLNRTGRVLSEVRLADFNSKIAGTADLVHLKYDGTIDLYDLKTASLTTNMKLAGKTNPWNPVEDWDGYKDKRYTTQMEYYARMIELETGQPISNRYIIPLVIEHENNDPKLEITKAKVLTPESTWDPKNFTYAKSGREIADRALRIQAHEPVTTAIVGVDDTNDLMTELTGRIEGRVTDPRKKAMDILKNRSKVSKTGELQYKNPLIGEKGTWVTLESSDPESQIDQIIKEFINQSDNYNRDLARSILNWMETGEDAFITGRYGQQGAKYIMRILNKYKGRTDLRVYDLNSVKGFENKIGWIVIEDPNDGSPITDLLYFTNDSLSTHLSFSRKQSLPSRLFFKRSLFLNFFSAGEAKYILDSGLRDTIGDAKKFEAGMIAMKLKEANPGRTFNEVMLSSLSDSGSSLPISLDLIRVVPLVGRVLNHKKMKDKVPLSMRDVIADKELTNWENYRTNWIRTFKNYAMNIADSRNQDILAGINNYLNDKTKLEELAQLIRTEMNEVSKETETSEMQSKYREYVLAQMLAQIDGMITAMTPISWVDKFISMPQNIANPVIQKLFVETKGAITTLVENFWMHKKKYDTALGQLIKESGGVLDEVSDRIVSQTSKYFEPLLERRELWVDRGDGRKKELLPTYHLIEEGSSEFARLAPAQQHFIKTFNDIIQDAAEMAEISWARGRIPVMKGTFFNQFYKGSRAVLAGKGLDRYGSILSGMLDNFDERTFFSNNAESRRFLQNMFTGQSNDEVKSGKWETAAGLNLDGDAVAVLDTYENVETNLELIADIFLINALRVKHFNKVMALFNAAEHIFAWQRYNLFEDRVTNNIEWLNVYRDAVINNRSVDAGSILDKAVRALTKMSSIALIGGKPLTAFIATTGQQLTSFSQALTNTATKNGEFGIKEWAKAHAFVLNPLNIKLVNAIMDQYQLFNMDMTSIVNGYHRSGNRSWLRMKWMFGLLTAGDWVSRSQIIIAQMMKQGVLDAYSMDGDILDYDETKDKRFQGKEGKEFYKLYKEEMRRQGYIGSDDRLTRAFDSRLKEKYKDQADSLIGGFDRETRGLYNFYATGKLLGLFKTWMPARMNRGFDTEFDKDVAGNWHVDTDIAGNKQLVWTGRQMEGILHSMLLYGWNLKQLAAKGETAELTEQQRENVARMGIDMAIMGVTIIGAMQIPDFEKETHIDDTGAYVLERGLDDILAIYDLSQYTELLYTPIAIDYVTKLWRNIMNIFAGIPDPDDRTFDRILDEVPVARHFEDLARQLDLEY